jgi:hypothetical protein
MDAVNFELSKPIAYANGKGAEIECSHIELREPTGKVSHTCCAIEGLIQTSVLQMAGTLGDDVVEAAKEEAAAQANTIEADCDEEKDGEAVLALMVGGGADMEKLVLHFRELFKEVAWMGGEKKITSARMDDMTHKDFRKMIGVYAANFILG